MIHCPPRRIRGARIKAIPRRTGTHDGRSFKIGIEEPLSNSRIAQHDDGGNERTGLHAGKLFRVKLLSSVLVAAKSSGAHQRAAPSPAPAARHICRNLSANNFSAPSGAAYPEDAAPDGAGNWFGCAGYKYAAPTALLPPRRRLNFFGTIKPTVETAGLSAVASRLRNSFGPQKFFNNQATKPGINPVQPWLLCSFVVQFIWQLHSPFNTSIICRRRP